MSDYKKPETDEKKAFFYFGFERLAPFSEVDAVINQLKEELAGDEEALEKINTHAEFIESYFDDEELKADDSLNVPFKKDKRRAKWESYKKDFPQVDLTETVEEAVEEVEEIEFVEEETVETIEETETVEEIVEDVVETKTNEQPPVFNNQHPQTKIYINGKLLGFCEDPISFTQEMREKRRNGVISHEMNITYYEENDEIYIFNDPGRARRPLIIVKNGVPLLTDDHMNKVANGKLTWDNLINDGLIEYLDAEEEENAYIAMSLADLSEEHTHLEIDPATMLGICAGIIPFSDHNSSPRNTMEAGMTKQALGLYVSNYALRTDTRAHLLHHPQTPIVKTRIIDSTNYDLRPSGQNFVVALMSYEGYNM